MLCSVCGTPLTPGARFCASCGAVVEDPEATRIARRDASPLTTTGDDESVVFSIRPTLLFVKMGYVGAALTGILLVALLAFQQFLNVPWYVSVPLAMLLLLAPAYYHIRRNLIRYTVTDSKVEIDQGLIARTTRNIPLRNIQDVTVSASILQRVLGYGDVIIDNASEQGGTTVLHNISSPREHADLLLRELRRWH